MNPHHTKRLFARTAIYLRKVLPLLICGLFWTGVYSQSGAAQQGTVSIIRSTGFTGSVKKYKLFMDGKFMCKIPNNSYVKYSVDSGAHSFAVQTGGKELWPATEQVEVSVTADSSFFLSIAQAMSMVDTRLNLNEVAQKNAEVRMKGLREAECISK